MPPTILPHANTWAEAAPPSPCDGAITDARDTSPRRAILQSHVIITKWKRWRTQRKWSYRWTSRRRDPSTASKRHTTSFPRSGPNRGMRRTCSSPIASASNPSAQDDPLDWTKPCAHPPCLGESPRLLHRGSSTTKAWVDAGYFPLCLLLLGGRALGAC
jgi:hypothetical protein